MTDNTTTLTIASTKINQDADGRYRLNDCHRAAGGDNAKRPSLWLANTQTQELIAEMAENSQSRNSCFDGKQPISTVKGGNASGTYACKELVIAYGMWINPKFHLMVIRAFDNLVQGKTPRLPSDHENKALNRALVTFGRLKTFHRRTGSCDTQAIFKAFQGTKEETGIDLAKRFNVTYLPTEEQVETLNATDIGRKLSMSARQVNAALMERGYQIEGRDSKGRIVWTPSEKGRPHARLEETARAHAGGTKQVWRWLPSIITELKALVGEAA